MSAINFTLLVCDAPSAKWPFDQRIQREITVIAVDLNDAKKTYFEKCPRFNVEFLKVQDASVAEFADTFDDGAEDVDRMSFLVSDAVKDQAFIEEMEPFPADCNPFRHDAMSMGSNLVRGWMAMHDGFDRAEEPMPLNWLYLVNTRSGRRVRIHLNDKVVEKQIEKDGSDD